MTKVTSLFWMLSTHVVCAGIVSPAETTALVKAEGFEDTGGWVVDQQVMDPCQPREIYERHLPEFKALLKAGVPPVGTTEENKGLSGG